MVPEEYHSVSFLEVVNSWDVEDVISWLRGLDDAVLPYMDTFRSAGVNGQRLLLVGSTDLVDMGIINANVRHIIANAIQMVITLCYEIDSENLQCIALQLSAKSRNLIHELRSLITPNGSKHFEWEALPNEVLLELSCLAEQTKKIISWLDRSPFNVEACYLQIREEILHLVVRIIQIIRSSCRNLGDTSKNIQMLCTQLCAVCDRVVEESTDPLVLQTAYLESVVVKRGVSTDELGFNIEAPYKGMHVINEVKFRSPADLCGRVTAGDEIVQVHNQTIIGWNLKSIVQILAACDTLEVPLLLKKRPRPHAGVVKPLISSNVKLPVAVDIPPTLTLRPLKKRRRSNSLNALRLSFNQLSIVHRDSVDKGEKQWVKSLPEPASTFAYNSTSSLKPMDRRRTTCSADELRDEVHVSLSRESGVNGEKGYAMDAGLMPSICDLNNLELGSFVERYQSYGGLQSVNQDECESTKEIMVADQSVYAKVELADQHLLQCDGINVDDFSSLEWQTTSTTVQFGPSMPVDDQETAAIPRSPGDRLSTCLSDMDSVGPLSSIDADWSYRGRVPSGQDDEDEDEGNSSMSASFQSNCTAPPLYSHSKVKLRKFFGESFDYPEARWYFDVTDRSETGSVLVLSPQRTYSGVSLEGWVYQAKAEMKKTRYAGRKWIKRWMVLKGAFLYVYVDSESFQPELVVRLPSCKVSPPGPEMKTRKKNVFKVQNEEMTAYFRVEQRREMLLWLKKLGLAAIGYTD